MLQEAERWLTVVAVIALGVLMIWRPDIIYLIGESWRSRATGTPPEGYLFMVRVLGVLLLTVCLVLIGILIWAGTLN